MKSCNCIAIDLPGHGKSQMYEISDLMELIPENAHLIGYSMGGRIALSLLCNYSNYFKKSVICSAHLGYSSEEDKRIRLSQEESWINDLRVDGIQAFINKWYTSPLFHDFPIPSYRYRQSPDHLIEAIQKFSLAKQQNFWNSVPSISPLSTFLYGENDEAYLQTYKRLQNLDANVHLIEKSAHAVHLQNAAACIKVIERSIHAKF